MKLPRSLVAALLFTSGAITLLASPAKKPNLLVILTDEYNLRTLGCYRALMPPEQAQMWGPGNVVETPNLDSIAQHGTLFNHMYTVAPVCMAARASMITGMYPHTIGTPSDSTKLGDGKYLRANVTTIATVLNNAGYYTGYAGKNHLAETNTAEGKAKVVFWSPHPVGKPDYHYGFQDHEFMFNTAHDKFLGLDAEGHPCVASRHPTLIGTDASGQPVYQDARSKNVKYTTDWLTDRAIDFVDKNKDRAFYYVLSIPDPHDPNIVRAPYDTMYTHMKFQYPRTYYQPRDQNTPKWRMPDGKTGRLLEELPQYFGMVKCINNIGRLLKKLKDDDILENTIIVFSADHGDLLGEHTRVNKSSPYEMSTRIPFLIMHGSGIANPLIPQNRVINEVGNTTDWMPTFLKLLGVECPKVAGRDLTPLLGQSTPADWNDITFSRLNDWKAAMNTRYKLYVDTSADLPWLIDLQNDPDEYVNLINAPLHADAAKRLARELKHYMEKNDDLDEKVTAKLDAILAN